MAKSRGAFRTISEVADWLDTPAHVLRFWESKFSQIKPVKRAGGRRYYRPEDMALLGGIKTLLHDEGMTIKGVQKMLREQGGKHVATLGKTPGAAVDITPDDPVAAPVVEPPAPLAKAVEKSPTPALDAANADPDDNVVPMAMPEPAPGPTLSVNLAAAPAPSPDPGDDDSDLPARMQPLLQRANRDTLHRRAAEIAPLVARLEALRERMMRP
ncbi:MerR family transcriptional regulator [Octadecabacter sp. SW4]|uniref:MerR family transcriptional regulator n=1 Tax=Octadecabacter sp. SW4 TaxID=2602067 RepID=UPI0011C1DC07|nr:MerR family transcriptional regulator [Octadecabacter sp. SW4]QEE35818.1 MerR family transcriptional regulator [Octadecabacter sp. SW4]